MLMASLLGLALMTNPVELGTIDWRRDFDAALEEAREKEKPLFVLFQEVPG
jgi:hypothetical protein